jgi:hypothetical protein
MDNQYQHTPYQSSSYGVGGSTTQYPPQAPNISQIGGTQRPRRLDNGQGAIHPQNLETLHRLGFPIDVSQLPLLFSQYQPDQRMPLSVGALIPTMASLMPPAAAQAPAISLRPRLEPQLQLPGLQTVPEPEIHHYNGETQRIEAYTKVKIESPTFHPFGFGAQTTTKLQRKSYPFRTSIWV